VLLVLVALGLLSSLALADATREWRVAALAADAVRAKAAAMQAMLEAAYPPDLHALCVSGALALQSREVSVAAGSASISWRPLSTGVFRAEVEGTGPLGARHRLQALLVPDSAERVMGLFRCPGATRLEPVPGRWLDGHPEG
jgi:hypothetical protein